jgi:hypothetical protein
VFVGLYLVGKLTPITEAQFWDLPAYKELKAFGMEGFSRETRTSVLLIDLVLQDFYAVWKGKLIIGWPPPERSWWRRANRNEYPIRAILEHGTS